MKIISLCIFMGFFTSNILAAPNCETILTVNDVAQTCNVKKLKYKISKHESGEGFFYCVREVRKSFGNSVMLNISHYKDSKKADNMARAGMGSGDNKIEELSTGDGGIAYHKSNKVMGDSYFVRYRKGNTFVELKYNHTSRNKPFCDLDDVKSLATIIDSRIK